MHPTPPIISIIVAMTENRVIGQGNKLPWHLPDDLQRFKRLTSGHTVIMGRKTFESIGRPLPNRTNIVITRTPGLQITGVQVANSLDAAIQSVPSSEDQIFIVGGAEIYRIAIPLAHRIYLTQIHTTTEGDAFFPELEMTQWHILKKDFHEIDPRHAYRMTFLDLIRI